MECDGCNTKADSALARVVRQSPEPFANNLIGMGGLIDVWLTTDTVAAPRNVLTNDKGPDEEL
jgi:hypothetical protein